MSTKKITYSTINHNLVFSANLIMHSLGWRIWIPIESLTRIQYVNYYTASIVKRGIFDGSSTELLCHRMNGVEKNILSDSFIFVTYMKFKSCLKPVAAVLSHQYIIAFLIMYLHISSSAVLFLYNCTAFSPIPLSNIICCSK